MNGNGNNASQNPPEPLVQGALSLVRNGLFQNDCDAAGFRLLNLDTSNLAIPGIPSQGAVSHKWFNSYDSGSLTWGVSQPAFSDLSGNLTTAQQSAIQRVGTISVGTWRGGVIQPPYLPFLDQILPPRSSLGLGNQNITLLADPVNDQDAVNYRTLNARTAGPPNPKAAVQAATTGFNVLIGLPLIDGYQTQQGDRILVKDQTSPRQWQNGIYNASAGNWTRTTDATYGDQLLLATTFVLNGTNNIGNTYVQVDVVPHIIGQNPIEWDLMSTTISLQPGNGLDVVGNTINAVGTAHRIAVGTGIDIASDYAGQTSIDTLGTVDIGTWEGNVIAGDYGGTGVANVGFHINLAGDFATVLATGAPIGSFLSFGLSGPTVLQLPLVGTLATLGGNEVFTNKHISASQIDSGILSIMQGGTGANSGKAAANNILPDQTGHGGQTLHTDGNGVLFWA